MNQALQIVREDPPAREYSLRVLQFPKKPIQGTRGKTKPRHSSATVTWLYRQFVEGHLPRYATSEQFIASTLPFLLRAMSAEAAMIMAAVFARRHAGLWHGQVAPHIDACRSAVRALTPLITGSVPDHISSRLQSLQPRCRPQAATALIICCSLADPRGRFFLDCRSLQRRLLLATPMTALRILQRLERTGAISRLESGNTPWEAKSAGDKRKANAYMITPK